MSAWMPGRARDVQAGVDHSRQMASALKSAGKPHQMILIEGAGHQLRLMSERMTLLTELEKFLSQHLGAGTLPSTGTPAAQSPQDLEPHTAQRYSRSRVFSSTLVPK